MSASDAKDESTRLMKLAMAPHSSVEQKREFYTSLFELAKYPDAKAKIQSGMFITSFFADFPDLQEEAIDLVYDLCEDEDEKVRIQGIKSLASVSEKDVSWLSRNTGVLLQLLACPPGELAHVHKALIDLINKSPVEVFHAIAQDCVVPAGGSTRHRALVLNFVSEHAAKERKTYLESGRYPEVEQVFSTGLLQALRTTSEQESALILRILMSLPSVSGPGVSAPQSLLQYLCRLPSPTPANIDAFARLTLGKPCDPRYPLLFLANHGSAVYGLGDRCLGFWKGIRNWQEKALANWPEPSPSGDVSMEGESQVDDLTKEVVISKINETFVDIAARQASGAPDGPDSLAAVMESLLFAIYRFHQAEPKLASSTAQQRTQLLALSTWIGRIAMGRIHLDTRRMWTNSKALASALASDSSRPLPHIIPSWQPLPASERLSQGEPSKRATRPPPTGPRASNPPRPASPVRGLNGQSQSTGGSGSKAIPSLLHRMGTRRDETAMSPSRSLPGLSPLPSRPSPGTDSDRGSASKRKYEEPPHFPPAEFSMRGRAAPPHMMAQSISSGKPSLLSRMEASSSAPSTPNEDRQGKRQRGSPHVQGSSPVPALLHRMSQTQGGAAPAAPVPIPSTSNQHTSFASAPSSSLPNPPSQAPSLSLSIKGKSSEIAQPLDAVDGSRLLDIRVDIIPPSHDAKEEGIVRKGRGFIAQSDSKFSEPSSFASPPQASHPTQPAPLHFKGAAQGVRGGPEQSARGAIRGGYPTGSYANRELL